MIGPGIIAMTLPDAERDALSMSRTKAGDNDNAESSDAGAAASALAQTTSEVNKAHTDIDWGRYAELFAFDDQDGIFYQEDEQ